MCSFSQVLFFFSTVSTAPNHIYFNDLFYDIFEDIMQLCITHCVSYVLGETGTIFILQVLRETCLKLCFK